MLFRSKDAEEKYLGMASRDHLERMVSHQTVRLFVPTTGTMAESLSFGRVVGRVWVLDADGHPAEQDVSEAMIESGFATRKKNEKED